MDETLVYDGYFFLVYAADPPDAPRRYVVYLDYGKRNRHPCEFRTLAAARFFCGER